MCAHVYLFMFVTRTEMIKCMFFLKIITRYQDSSPKYHQLSYIHVHEIKLDSQKRPG